MSNARYFRTAITALVIGWSLGMLAVVALRVCKGAEVGQPPDWTLQRGRGCVNCGGDGEVTYRGRDLPCPGCIQPPPVPKKVKEQFAPLPKPVTNPWRVGYDRATGTSYWWRMTEK